MLFQTFWILNKIHNHAKKLKGSNIILNNNKQKPVMFLQMTENMWQIWNAISQVLICLENSLAGS